MFAIVFTLMSAAAFGQSPSPSFDNKHFAALVQYMNGPAHFLKRDHGPVNDVIGFKTLLHTGDSLAVDGTLKLITSSRCIAVVYGPAQISFSSDESGRSNSTITGGSLRWICGPQNEDHIFIEQQALTLNNAEVFYHNGHLLVRKGPLLTNEGALEGKAIYQYKNRHWQNEDASDFQRFEMNKALEAPQEALVEPQPRRPITSRFIVGPIFGWPIVFTQNSRFGIPNPEGNGARLLVNYKIHETSWLFEFSYYETQDRNDGPHDGPSNPPELSNRLQNVQLAVGQRLRHDSSWSLYYKAGLGLQTLKLNAFYQDINQAIDEKLLYTNINGAFGIDKTFLTQLLGFAGLYVAAEVFATQTLFVLHESHGNGAAPSDNGAFHGLRGPVTQVGLMIHFGPLLQF
jgi:hypothetical protein